MSEQAILQCARLGMAFAAPRGRIEVLEGIDFELKRGESVSVSGESGAGKTTLLYLLSALETPLAGQVWWEGVDVFTRSADWRARTRARFAGFVFQAYYLVPELNALENVLLAGRVAGANLGEARQRARNLLDKVGLAERARHLPSQLSGGERQRVALARALMNRPQVILADEPTGNLDEHTAEGVMDLLLGLCREQNCSLLLVTHNPRFANLTDRHLWLRTGSLAPVDDNPASLSTPLSDNLADRKE